MAATTREIIGIILLSIGILVLMVGIFASVAYNSFAWWSWLIIILSIGLMLAGALMLLITEDENNLSKDKSDENVMDYISTISY